MYKSYKVLMELDGDTPKGTPHLLLAPAIVMFLCWPWQCT
jgi:hypothetical protein